MNLKNTVKELFSFSRTGRIGFLVLLTAIVAVAIAPFLYSKKADYSSAPPDTSWMQAARALQETSPPEPYVSRNKSESSPFYSTVDKASAPQGILFDFDPNQLDADGFKKLGLRDRTIRTLLNYRSKGGRFRKPGDLAKIYGLRPEEFARLQPFIKIEERKPETYHRPPREERDLTGASPTTDKSFRYTRKIIDINSATIADFESLYGIGNRLASRIINFREKLGGFYAVEQVGETYGVPDSVFQKIKSQLAVSTPAIKKIDLNTAGYEELNAHPYINARTSFQILKYRKEKGHFGNIEEIRNLVQAGDNFEKMAPYLSAE